MAFSIEKYTADENPEFEGIEQVKTNDIVGDAHTLDYVEFGTKKDGTKYARVRAKFKDDSVKWYYTASYGLVGMLERVKNQVGYIPADAYVKIGKVDVGGKNPMLVYMDA